MSSKKSKVWLVTLDTNSPQIYPGHYVCKWGELLSGANSQWVKLTVNQSAMHYPKKRGWQKIANG